VSRSVRLFVVYPSFCHARHLEEAADAASVSFIPYDRGLTHLLLLRCRLRLWLVIVVFVIESSRLSRPVKKCPMWNDYVFYSILGNLLISFKAHIAHILQISSPRSRQTEMEPEGLKVGVLLYSRPSSSSAAAAGKLPLH